MPRELSLTTATTARAGCLTLLVAAPSGAGFNVGSDQPVTTAELPALVAATPAPGKPVVLEHAIAVDGARSVYVPDIGKATRLGLTVETPLVAAIRMSARVPTSR